MFFRTKYPSGDIGTGLPGGSPVPVLRAAVAGLIVLIVAGCTATPVTDRLIAAPSDGTPTAVELTEVPFYPQTEYHCGPAAMATVLTHLGQHTTPDRIAGMTFTPGRQGSLQADMVTAARRSGVLPVRVTGMDAAFEEVAAGNPVLILQNLGLEMAPAWHYAVLVGFDLDREVAILRSGTVERYEMPIATLERTWARAGFWGLILTPPSGPIPATAGLGAWMDEASAMEETGDSRNAALAYRQALGRWPESAFPWFALGNLRFADGNLSSAIANYREAIARDAGHQAALNNLAYALLQAGNRGEARRIAELAVAIDGPHNVAARRTLDEILAAEG
ncbi:MAG: PA2778 family cysteine peptidase [Alphaproteobacteria bacterium]